MQHIVAVQAQGRRNGRPLVYSLTEIAALVLVAAALIATAALPAMTRHPHYAQAKTTASVSIRR